MKIKMPINIFNNSAILENHTNAWTVITLKVGRHPIGLTKDA